MGTDWDFFQKYLMPYPSFFRESESERVELGQEKQEGREDDWALDSGYYGTPECQAILQPLYMGHFLTALASGQATATQ